MSVMTPCDPGSPLMRAWEVYRRTAEYENTARWAGRSEHTEGSLWAAFEKGWNAALAAQPEEERDGRST